MWCQDRDAEEVKHLYRVAWEDPKDPDKVSILCGARTGMAEEVKHLYRVAWEDPKDPDKVSIVCGARIGMAEEVKHL